jgi:hypothetical protein
MINDTLSSLFKTLQTNDMQMTAGRTHLIASLPFSKVEKMGRDILRSLLDSSNTTSAKKIDL